MKNSKRQGKRTSRDEMRRRTEILVLGAMLTAIVIVLQLLGSFVNIGSVANVSLVLIPIVIGAALCGPSMGAWLGLVFSVVVLCQPATQFFFNMSPAGTVIIVLTKGILCGYASGMIFKVLSKVNTTLAVFVAAAACPVINTAIFAVGCFTFFLKDIAAQSGDMSTFSYVFIVYIGLNFVFEFLFNIVLSPVIVKLVEISKKMLSKKQK